MPTIRAITAEATAVCKGVEMTHGNSAHFLTFELDSGERIYFQVSMKCFMLIVEGDRCLITYKSLTNSPKKKLKSFERIGVATKPGATHFISTSIEAEQMDDDGDGEETFQEVEYQMASEEVAMDDQAMLQQQLEGSREVHAE